jgi:hypothetical protein
MEAHHDDEKKCRDKEIREKYETFEVTILIKQCLYDCQSLVEF